MQFLGIDLSDEELVLLAKAGDDRAFEALLLRYDALINNITRKFFIQGNESGDVLQIARIALWEAAQHFDPGRGLFRPFMGMVVKRRLQSAVRHSFSCTNLPCFRSCSLDAIIGDENDEQLYNRIGVEEDPLRNYDDSVFKCEFSKFIHNELSETEYRIVVEMLNRKNSKDIDKDRRGRISIYRDISRKLNIPEKGVDNAWQRVKRKYKSWYEDNFGGFPFEREG
ncbi:sigma-70 family RNA polymerase sigma factor [Phosphitispora fastidiosa]|uniref:sigma-70 family RNA polymerase sigma factor n=1 Tax=Phosphitispora fastidiosa TaxID=2837202 RepID=UPI001E5CA662|nr:sigma-70 family RNA polymerase sigma factor [Phosphitispora fastidiosa]MBU7008033.1 RNA polymerase sporulation-specific sigma factor [Phosphitispora fastidiosa]